MKTSKEVHMKLLRLSLTLVLVLSAIALFSGCASSPPPPPPPVVEAPPPPPPAPPLYFVNVSSLALRSGPTTAAPQISTLYFNEEVELLDSSAGWARVRVMGRPLEGWASMKYLQPVPADRPRSVPAKRKAPAEPSPKATGTPKAM
jgi:hypothetical protein